MADQKRWFKVWTSIISDDDFDPTRPAGLVGLGRFCILGAYTALHGENGVLQVMPDTLLRVTQAANLDELKRDIALKNVSFEEGKNRYGKVTVTWSKWEKYQEDSTHAERQKRYRARQRDGLRREEIRGEERRSEEKRIKDAEPASPAPSADSLKSKKKQLDESIKIWADQIYQTDTNKYSRLVQWIKAAERNYRTVVIASALERFLPFAANVRDWWPYLDQILDKQEAILNARDSEAESERHKTEIRELAAMFGGPRLRS